MAQLWESLALDIKSFFQKLDRPVTSESFDFSIPLDALAEDPILRCKKSLNSHSFGASIE
jgi:hypothetical protein